MPEPVGPGEPGYNPDRWFQHIVNTGLSLARRVGTGLALFNALRSRLPGIARDILGAAARIIGQGVRAAIEYNRSGPDHVVNVDALPLAPKGFFGPEEVNRIVGITDVPGEDTETGETVYHQTRINWPEDWSKGAIEDVIELVATDTEDESPGMHWRLKKELRDNMVWIGKKY